MTADKTQTYCPRLEGLVPWFLSCNVLILMNSLIGLSFITVFTVSTLDIFSVFEYQGWGRPFQ